MTDDTQYEEYKSKISEYLSSVGGKGADTIINIGKGIGLKRREVSKIIARMEMEGLVQPAGVTAGVAGYKLVAK
jgi:DNA-binding MarR family transcriptional regulator